MNTSILNRKKETTIFALIEVFYESEMHRNLIEISLRHGKNYIQQ